VPEPSPREVFLLQRKASKVGEGLAKTTGWIRRALLKSRRVTMLGGVEYVRVDDEGLHITVDGAPRVLEVDTAQPGDELVISYANERNESGAFETIETRVVAGRRVTLYSIDFEQEVPEWLLQGYWHLTNRRAASATHSLYFSKKKGSNDRKSYTKAGSSGVAYPPFIELQNMAKPQLEFDYYFSGLETPSDLMSLTARNFPFSGGSTGSDEPSLPLTFDVRPTAEIVFRQAKVDLQYIGNKRAYFSFTCIASSADVKRNKFEGFYLDNVRVTAISTR